MPLKVAKWSALFEVAKSRKVGTKSWGVFPLKNGLGFTRLVTGAATPERGVALYGAWMLLIRVLHLQPGDVRDGWLTEDGTPTGTPLTAETLSILTRGPDDLFKELLARCADPAVGWIEDHAAAPGASRKPRSAPAITFDFKAREFVGITDAVSAAWCAEFPSVDFNRQLVRMKEWLTKPGRKRRGDLSKFIRTWLANEVARQDSKPKTLADQWKTLPDGVRQYVAQAVRAHAAASLGHGDKAEAGRIAEKARDNFPRHAKAFTRFVELVVNNPGTTLDPWPT